MSRAYACVTGCSTSFCRMRACAPRACGVRSGSTCRCRKRTAGAAPSRNSSPKAHKMPTRSERCRHILRHTPAAARCGGGGRWRAQLLRPLHGTLKQRDSEDDAVSEVVKCSCAVTSSQVCRMSYLLSDTECLVAHVHAEEGGHGGSEQPIHEQERAAQLRKGRGRVRGRSTTGSVQSEAGCRGAGGLVRARYRLVLRQHGASRVGRA